MAHDKNLPAGNDWVVTLDERRSGAGVLRVLMLGAKNGQASASLSAWAISQDQLLEFLQGAVETLARKYGKVSLARGFPQ